MLWNAHKKDRLVARCKSIGLKWMRLGKLATGLNFRLETCWTCRLCGCLSVCDNGIHNRIDCNFHWASLSFLGDWTIECPLWSKADIAARSSNFRFASNSGHQNWLGLRFKLSHSPTSDGGSIAPAILQCGGTLRQVDAGRAKNVSW